MHELETLSTAEAVSSRAEESTIDDLIGEILRDDSEAAAVYLKQTVLASMVQSLFEIRRAAMTQADLAERLGKQQSAIARLEAREPAKITLGQFWDVAVACGLLPLVPEFVPLERAREFLLEQWDARLQIDAFRAWCTQKVWTDLRICGNSPAIAQVAIGQGAVGIPAVENTINRVPSGQQRGENEAIPDANRPLAA